MVLFYQGFPTEEHRLRNRKAALLLSFICPGLGQIYKREVLKGINFIIICALLILPLFCFSSPPRLLHLLRLSILLILWLVGMADAYMDDELFMGRHGWFAVQRVLAILPLVVIFIAVAALLMLWTQDPAVTNERLMPDADLKATLDDSPNQADAGTSIQSDNSIYFSVQVAAFRELERAEAVYRDLLSKGYTVRIGQFISADELWHRVIVGKFPTEQDAMSFTETLHERERFSDMVVRRWTPEKESVDLP